MGQSRIYWSIVKKYFNARLRLLIVEIFYLYNFGSLNVKIRNILPLIILSFLLMPSANASTETCYKEATTHWGDLESNWTWFFCDDHIWAGTKEVNSTGKRWIAVRAFPGQTSLLTGLFWAGHPHPHIGCLVEAKTDGTWTSKQCASNIGTDVYLWSQIFVP